MSAPGNPTKILNYQPKGKNFRKIFETVEGLCHVVPGAGPKSPNAGKDEMLAKYENRKTKLNAYNKSKNFLKEIVFAGNF